MSSAPFGNEAEEKRAALLLWHSVFKQSLGIIVVGY